jgi:hypothetical protein
MIKQSRRRFLTAATAAIGAGTAAMVLSGQNPDVTLALINGR